jgi:hypothetical protein
MYVLDSFARKMGFPIVVFKKISNGNEIEK